MSLSTSSPYQVLVWIFGSKYQQIKANIHHINERNTKCNKKGNMLCYFHYLILRIWIKSVVSPFYTLLGVGFIAEISQFGTYWKGSTKEADKVFLLDRLMADTAGSGDCNLNKRKIIDIITHT